MKITKSELEVMMQEEAGKLTPRTEITSSEIKKMMEEELAAIDEAPATGYDLNKQISSALDKLEGGDHRGAAMILYDVLENLESDDPQHNPTVGVGGFDDEGYSTIGGSRPMQEARKRLAEGIHYEGLMEAVSDFTLDQLQGWHEEAKVSLRQEVQANGFDLADVVMQGLGGGGSEVGSMRDPYGAPMRETRKHPLKRDSEKFARNTDMVSGLQKTITSYLKETGAKLDVRHREIIERMSTRLMHVANSPMIRLEEGDATSRMITQLEQIGKEIQDANRASSDPDTIGRLDRIDQMVTQLFDEMHNLL